MFQMLPEEKWKKVEFNFKYNNNFILEVSNHGNLRSTHKNANKKPLKGSTINGYKIVRIKLFTKRDKATQEKFDAEKQQLFKLARKIKSMKALKESKLTIQETEKLLLHKRKKLTQKYRKETLGRTINYHALIHKLVAEYFLPKPKPTQTIVAHLNYNKLNNTVINLQWMTPEENYAHQRKSPYVIKYKKLLKENIVVSPNVAKLTVTKVMLIKKLLNEGKTARKLAKTFKVSDMQIIRIKRGENWKNIPAAQ
ncbi:MAG: HNH endonuclease [Bacteroidetes bacterium]|nr:HNH endonuclease [Bacteroidota bacterium]MBS1591972.1 HNH endonuclease [Bacteroidota bacterium]